MKRVFCGVYLLLMAVAAVDCLVRVGGQTPSSLHELGVVAIFSSVSAVMLASVVFLAGDAYWLVCVPAFVWGIACSGMEWFFRSYFAGSTMVGEQLMVSIVTLSQEKVMAFICENWTAWNYIVCGAGFLGVLISVAWMTSRTVGKPTARSFLLGLALFVGMGCLVPFVMNHDHLMMALLDHGFVRGSDELTMYRELKERGEPLKANAYGTAESNLLAVVVIGESSTRTHWSLYGYSRKTTPRLDALADRLLVFSNVTATVALTPFALRDLFTERAKSRVVSVPSAAVSAGYETSLYSGQAKMGLYEGSDELLFAACENRQYLCDLLPTKSYHDEELIPLVRKALASTQPKQLVFVHTYGSHCFWGDRFPSTFAGFPKDLRDNEVEGLPEKVVCSFNDYDTSILYTDFVVSELLSAAQAQARPTVFVYVSDHGESPRTVGRDHKNSDTHAIPLFIWLSQEYRDCHPDRVARLQAMCAKPLTTRDFYPVWMDLLGLSER